MGSLYSFRMLCYWGGGGGSPQLDEWFTFCRKNHSKEVETELKYYSTQRRKAKQVLTTLCWNSAGTIQESPLYWDVNAIECTP